MNCRHFGIEDESSTGFFELPIYGRHDKTRVFGKKGGGGGEGVDASAYYAFLPL